MPRSTDGRAGMGDAGMGGGWEGRGLWEGGGRWCEWCERLWLWFLEGCGCSSVEVRDNISEALDNTSGVRDNAEGLCTITRRGDPVRHGIIRAAMEI